MKQTFLNLFYVLVSLIGAVLSTDFKVTKWTQYPNLSRNSMKFVGVSVGQCVDECTRRLSCGSVGYRNWLNLCEVHLEDVTPEDNADDGSYIFIKKDDMLKKKAAAKSVKKAGHVCDESTGHCHKECETFVLEKGQVYGNRRHAGAKVAFSCDGGYREKNGEKSAVCEQSGEWSYYPKCLPAHVGVQATLISAAVTTPETQTNFQETTTPSQGTALFSLGTTKATTATSPTAALPETTVSSQGTTPTTTATSPTTALPGTTVSSQGPNIKTTATSPTAALPETSVSSQGTTTTPTATSPTAALPGTTLSSQGTTITTTANSPTTALPETTVSSQGTTTTATSTSPTAALPEMTVSSQGTTITTTATSPTTALPETTVSSQGTTTTATSASPTTVLPGTTLSSQGTTITTTTTSPTTALPGTTVSSQGAGSLPGHLLVNNGGKWGNWGNAVFCPEGSYASGYDMKIQSYQGEWEWTDLNDDTSLNGIRLYCDGEEGQAVHDEITSKVGSRGDWVGPAFCNHSNGLQFFLIAFNLQVQPSQGYGTDDTAANFVKFKCRDHGGDFPSNELAKEPGYGHSGSYEHWSEECLPGTAICGLETRVDESPGDKTALNDVIFYCCN